MSEKYLCRHCRIDYPLKRALRRGLCCACYKDLEIRQQYDSLFRWSQDELAALRKAFHEGLSDKEIAEELGRKYYSVRQKRLQLGLSGGQERRIRSYVKACYDRTRPRGCWHASAKSWTVEEKSLLLSLFEKGLNDKELAKQMGRSVGSVNRARRRLGVKVDKARQVASMVKTWKAKH